MDALTGVEAGDLADIPGLAEHAEPVLAAARAEKDRRAGSSVNSPIEKAPSEATAEPDENAATEPKTTEEEAPTKEAK